MDTLRLIFTICAVGGGTLFIIRLILQFTGVFDETDLGADAADVGDAADAAGAADAADMDFGEEGLADSDVSFRLLSFQGITAFFMMFGLVGRALLLESRVSAPFATGGAVAAGVFSMWVVAKLFQFAKKLQSSGTLDIRKAIGAEGTVYLTIPADGTGKVQITVQEHLRIFNAVAEDKEEIKTGEAIKVVRVTGDSIMVVKTV